MQVPQDTAIRLAQHSPWVWHVIRDGKRLGTISGDSIAGFTARDIHYESIGRDFVTAEAALQAWVSDTDR